MKSQINIKSMVLLGLMAAVLVILAYTPLGYLNIGPLAITFNTIPVAIAAIALGPVGGIVASGVFGLTSFLQCFGGSVLGTTLFGISPILTVFQCQECWTVCSLDFSPMPCGSTAQVLSQTVR